MIIYHQQLLLSFTVSLYRGTSDLRAEGFLQTEPLMGDPTLLLCKLVVFISPPMAILSTAHL